MNIAILGFGTVGRGTYEILEQRKKTLKNILGEDLHVKKVLVLPQEVESSGLGDVACTDYQEILDDDSIALVVELTGAKAMGREFMVQAMTRKKHVVTANKAVVSAHWQELLTTAEKNRVHFLFEAAVGGGIPVLTPLRTQIALGRVTEVQGILNGTCNFLLTSMFSQGSDYAPTLKLCQELGYAEADPTDDVEGFDTLRKLKILLSLMSGRDIPEDSIPVVGISRISADDISLLKARQLTVKLLAEGELLDNGNYSASVFPEILKDHSPLGAIDDATNSVALHGEFVEDLQFNGPGAGKFPTGNAVVADILDALQGYVRPVSTCPPEGENRILTASFRAYVRGADLSDLDPGKIQESGSFGKETWAFTSPLPLKEILALYNEKKAFVALMR